MGLSPPPPARILLIGAGLLPSPQTRTLGFPQLRLAGLRDALVGAGYTVHTVCLSADPAPPPLPEEADSAVTVLSPEAAGWQASLRALSAGADVLVSAGPYLPGAAACAVADNRPVWVDLPGDPFAELQAVARAQGDRLAPSRQAAALNAALSVLSRADHIGVISERQRLACLGQLGLLGRLLDPTGPAEGPVSVVPVAYHLPLARGLPRRRAPGAPLTVALSGGFNTWFDDRTAAMALQRAMDADPRLRVVVTGGAIPGHYTEGHARFERWRLSSPHRHRVQMRGWLQHEALTPVLSAADVGLCLDRPGCEALLGSRTRLHLFAWMGLEMVATPQSELARQLADAALLHPVPLEDPLAVADRLLGLVREGSDGQQARRAGTWLSRRYAPESCYAPLLSWVAHPTRTPPAPAAQPLLDENARLQDDLRRVHQSPTWQVLSRLHRLSRRLRGAAGAPAAPSGSAPPDP